MCILIFTLTNNICLKNKNIKASLDWSFKGWDFRFRQIKRMVMWQKKKVNIIFMYVYLKFLYKSASQTWASFGQGNWSLHKPSPELESKMQFIFGMKCILGKCYKYGFTIVLTKWNIVLYKSYIMTYSNNLILCSPCLNAFEFCKEHILDME